MIYLHHLRRNFPPPTRIGSKVMEWQSLIDRASAAITLSADIRPEALFETIYAMAAPGASDQAAAMTTKRLITRREEEVVRLVLAGLSNDQIADRLYLAVPTVKSHLQRIYRKLGIERRNQLITLLPLIAATLQALTSLHDSLSRAFTPEAVYSVGEAQTRLTGWRRYFNEERLHSSLGYQTPIEFAKSFAGNGAETEARLGT
jgi:DNA-binding CsgD family transcriptional regulator